MISRLINFTICLVICGIFFCLGENIPLSEQLPIFDSLRETASIVFTVMGIWIAVIFPEVLKRLTGKNTQADTEGNYKTVHKLVLPMIFSTFVIAVVLFVGICVPVVKHIALLKQFTSELRGISFATLGVLTYLLFWSLIGTLVPQDIVLSGIKRIEERKKLIERFFGGSKE